MGGIDELTARVPQAPAETRRGFRFHGDGGTLWGISVVTLLLSICTLGIYYPWGKVKARKYLYGQTEFEGDRFAFHGTGKELLVGWIKVAVVLGALFGLNVAAEIYLESVAATVGANLLFAAVSFSLVPLAIVGSHRYRLARTSWRGIRFSFRGKLGPFVRKFAGGSLFTALTFGIYAPWFQNDMRKALMSESWFGNTPFEYDGDGRALFGRFKWLLVLFIPTLGLYSFWYRAFRERYFWEHTSVAGARFNSGMTGGGLLVLDLTNLLLLACTLGIALPWVRVRTIRYKLGHLTLIGSADFGTILQEATEAGAAGEELSDFVGNSLFDIEIGL